MENLREEMQNYVVRTLKHIIALSGTDAGEARVPEKKAQLKTLLSNPDHFTDTLNLVQTPIGDDEVAILAEIAPENIHVYNFFNTEVTPDCEGIKELSAKPYVREIILQDLVNFQPVCAVGGDQKTHEPQPA